MTYKRRRTQEREKNLQKARFLRWRQQEDAEEADARNLYEDVITSSHRHAASSSHHDAPPTFTSAQHLICAINVYPTTLYTRYHATTSHREDTFAASKRITSSCKSCHCFTLIGTKYPCHCNSGSAGHSNGQNAVPSKVFQEQDNSNNIRRR